MKGDEMITTQEVYATRRAQISQQIRQLNDQLTRLDQEHTDEPERWDIVGDLTTVQDRLTEALEFITPEI